MYQVAWKIGEETGSFGPYGGTQEDAAADAKTGNSGYGEGTHWVEKMVAGGWEKLIPEPTIQQRIEYQISRLKDLWNQEATTLYVGKVEYQLLSLDYIQAEARDEVGGSTFVVTWDGMQVVEVVQDNYLKVA